MLGDRTIAYNEPILWEPEVINSVVHVKEMDAAKMWKLTHPENEYTDEQARDEFMMVNLAWFVEDKGNETS